VNPGWRTVRLIVSGLALAAGAGRLAAQQTTLAAGRVVRIDGADTTSLAGARVVLHRVARSLQGPIDSLLAGHRGEFRFRYPIDTSAIYLLSSGYKGIEYFSTPLRPSPVHPDTGLLLIVSDTSSTVRLSVASRHIVIGKPAQDGTRPTLEIVVLENNGFRTRVAGNDSGPTWAARLPAGALNFQVGQGDVSQEAVEFRHDSVLLFAPVAPGEKQLLYTYEIPASPGTVRIPIDDSVSAVNVLLEEFDRKVSGGEISKGDSTRIENREFQQWVGPAAPGAVVSIDFPRSRTGWLLPALVGLVGAGLIATLVLGLRRRAVEPAASGAGPLLDELARLDARYAGQEGEVPPEEWRRYQDERARLKQEVSTRLAGSRRLS